MLPHWLRWAKFLRSRAAIAVLLLLSLIWPLTGVGPARERGAPPIALRVQPLTLALSRRLTSPLLTVDVIYANPFFDLSGDSGPVFRVVLFGQHLKDAAARGDLRLTGSLVTNEGIGTDDFVWDEEEAAAGRLLGFLRCGTSADQLGLARADWWELSLGGIPSSGGEGSYRFRWRRREVDTARRLRPHSESGKMSNGG